MSKGVSAILAHVEQVRDPATHNKVAAAERLGADAPLLNRIKCLRD
jgi:hypothetical protein